MSDPITRAPLADAPADAEASSPEIVAKGFHPLARFRVKLPHADGTTKSLTRDLLCVGPVVGVLAIDPVRDALVLIRQFRLGAHLALGLGELVEIVAGHVEAGETYEQAARRECIEEIGIAPRSLHPLFTFMPAPGSNDEHATMFLAVVDAARVPERGGAAHESEDTRPFCVDVDTALAALGEGRVHNGYLILALQWLALNRHRVGVIAAGERR
jgi:ADP-ribose pyrophosphatase